MYERVVNFLRCPACGGGLTLDSLRTSEADGPSEVVEGLLHCNVDHWYPIVRGIPRLLPDAFDQFDAEVRTFPLGAASERAREVLAASGAPTAAGMRYDRRTQDNFSREWDLHEIGDRTWGIDLEDRVERYFLQAVDIPPDQLAGRVMLDAGCGNGSQSVAYTRFGLEVIAVDLSSGLEHGYAARHRYEGARADRVHFVQADLQTPILARSSVDIVHSAGVLHHTPNTERTFLALCPLVRPGGAFYVWLYKRERFVTGLVNSLRALTTRIPTPTFARLARLLADPFRVFCWAVNALGVRSYPPLSRREAALALMDIFGAPFAHAHTFDEVAGWMRAEGFSEVWPCNETRRGFGACGRRDAAISPRAPAGATHAVDPA